MEKDHFKDRGNAGKNLDEVKIGLHCYICTKENQKTAQYVEDLQKGIIVECLTSKKYHPRGIKVKIFKMDQNQYASPETIEKIINFYQKNKSILSDEKSIAFKKHFAKGRIVYLLDDHLNKII